jgi:hypothetical protein
MDARWHDKRQLYFALQIGQMLFPTYAQFYNDLMRIIVECQSPEITEMLRKKLTTNCGNYFIGAGIVPAAAGNAPSASEVIFQVLNIFANNF